MAGAVATARTSGLSATEPHGVGIAGDVETRGTGKPVLFLHGASTVEGTDFVVSDLSVRWLLPLHPGFGGSAPDDSITSIDALASHYLGRLDALRLERVGLVGFSMGGWVAARLAIAAPDRIDRLCLVAPAGLDITGARPTDLSGISPDGLPAYLAHDAAVARRYFPAQPTAKFLAMRAAEARALEQLTGGKPLLDPALADELATIACPTLVVWGERDRMQPVGLARHWVAGLRFGQSLIVPGAGHFVLQERPETVSAIADFMKGRTSGPAGNDLPKGEEL